MIAPMPRDNSYDVIFLSDAIGKIQEKYGDRYFAVPEAQQEAAALWGVKPDTDHINDCGVFTYTSDAMTLCAGNCKAELSLVEAPNHRWAISTGYSTSISGGGYAPSVWNRLAYPSRDDARLAGIFELISRFDREGSSINSCNSDANRQQCRKIIALLEAEKTPQLALF